MIVGRRLWRTGKPTRPGNRTVYSAEHARYNVQFKPSRLPNLRIRLGVPEKDRAALSSRLVLSQLSFGILSELTTHATRGSVAKTPYFPGTISCLVVIM